MPSSPLLERFPQVTSVSIVDDNAKRPAYSATENAQCPVRLRRHPKPSTSPRLPPIVELLDHRWEQEQATERYSSPPLPPRRQPERSTDDLLGELKDLLEATELETTESTADCTEVDEEGDACFKEEVSSTPETCTSNECDTR